MPFPSLSELIQEYRNITCTNHLNARTLKTIKSLLIQHCQHFAFSTLAANMNHSIVELDGASLANYLLSHRQGLCFHHNITFYEVLKSMGFEVRLVACWFKQPKKNTYYPHPTHVAILLTMPEGRYLIDPGYGYAITDIMPLDQEVDNNHNYKPFKINHDEYELREKDKTHYKFNKAPVELSYFHEAVAILKRPDEYEPNTYNLKIQGHLFYSYFMYSVLQNGSLKMVSVQLTSNKGLLTEPSSKDFYSQFLDCFPENSTIKMLDSPDFTNPLLSEAILELTTKSSISCGVHLRSSL